ncbi:hypothetical protein E2320_004591 [Naja naja]|nr:hypothetical protein E2320_004591 [Naja naja]
MLRPPMLKWSICSLTLEQILGLLMQKAKANRAGSSQQCTNADISAEKVPINLCFFQTQRPLSLMQLCRLCIRSYLGVKTKKRISELMLPDELKKFLLVITASSYHFIPFHRII